MTNNLFVSAGYRALSLLVYSFFLTVLILNHCVAQQLPIKPERTISFQTAEGSYMDADISPNGKTIVFDLLGDLYTLPISGGTAMQLTHGLAYDRHPTWSPDGKQVAFLSDASGAERLEIIDIDSKEQRTLGASFPGIDIESSSDRAKPSWAPDGNYIALDGFLYSLAGGRMTLPLQINKDAQFSPDGRFLYYNDYKQVCRYDRHDSSLDTIAIAKDNLFMCPRVSPDGRWLAYVTEAKPESSLRVRNLGTGEDKLLAAAVERYKHGFDESFAFTPDSRSLLIGFKGHIHHIDISSGADHIIPFRANVNVDCGRFNYNTFKLNHDTLRVKYTRSVNMSPDGKSLVFSALNRIYTMSVPKGKPHVLVEQADGQYQPVYSPDGRWVAYVTWNDKNGGQVWRVPATGGKPMRITSEQGYYEHPAWSPDGEMIAVLKDSLPAPSHEIMYSNLGQLQLIDIKNAITRKVADSVPLWTNLSFSTDGKRLTYMLGVDSYRSDAAKPILTSSSLDGKNRILLATIDYNDSHNNIFVPGFYGLQQISISPNGHYIVYNFNEDLYIAAIPNLGLPISLNSRTDAVPLIRFATGGIEPHWEHDKKTLSWSYGNRYYRMDPDRIIKIAEKAASDSARQGKTAVFDNGYFQINVVPDQIIQIPIRVPKYYAHGSIALRDVRIISMKDNEVIEHGTIVITDGRFAAVGTKEHIEIPPGSKIFDLKGKTIIPGLIDMHDHMDTAPDVFEQQCWKYLANLAYGVTTARDPSSSFDSFGDAELLETGQMTGPRLFSVGRPVLGGSIELKSLDNARAVIKKRAEFGAVTIKQYEQETRLQRQWLLMACHEAGLNMTNEGDDIQECIAMIKDGTTGFEHNPRNLGNVYNDVVTLIAKSKVWLTPTLQVRSDHSGEPARPYFLHFHYQQPDMKTNNFWPAYRLNQVLKEPAPRDTVHPAFIYNSSVDAAIRHAGGHVTMGSHGNDEGIGAHWETWALQMGGLSNMEALQAATIEGAEGLGMQQYIGSIEVGKLADLVILDKNPLEDIHNTLSIKYVMKDGVLYEGNTLNTIWPVKKKLPEWRYNPTINNDSKTKK